MPYAYIFKNHLGGGIQHSSSAITDRFQLHTIQNFEYLQIKKEVSFEPNFVNVVLMAVDFSDGSLLITACSGCSSCQALKIYLPSGSCKYRKQEFISLNFVLALFFLKLPRAVSTSTKLW
jgi:hypothetical protein